MALSSFLVGVILISAVGYQDAQAVTLNKHPKLVVFSFDGFRFDYMSLADLPNMRALRASGVTTPYMIPQFITKTFTNHQSIVTGLYAEEHGIVENAVYDPLHGEELSGYDDDHDFWDYSNNSIPIWLLNEEAGDGRISGAQFPGSTQPYGKDQKYITHLLNYDGSRPFEERMDITLKWLTNDTHPANLVFMYFEEPDKQGHAHGPNSPEVKAAVENLDQMLAYFLRQLTELGIQDLVNIMIVSDHGMEEVKDKNKIPLDGLIDPALKYTQRGGSPVLQIWPDVEGETEKIYQEFLAASKTRPFSVYKKDEVPERWHYNNRRVSPILLMSEPGFIFGERWKNTKILPRANVDPEPRRGVHGYDTMSTNMRAFFLANGPAFKKGIYIEPFQNVDLFPLMCHMMGFEPPGHNGTLSRVRPALLVPNPGDSNPAKSLTASPFLSFLLANFLLRSLA